jgi:hypothetical protein
MFEKRIQMEEGARLMLDEMASDVKLTSWNEADVLIRSRDGQEEDLTVQTTKTGPAVSARVACEVQVPAPVAVTVRQVAGNLKVKGLGEFNAEQVRGNLKLSDVGEAVVAEVYGNLQAGATASLRLVGTVFGDASLSAVPTADLQNVRGNLRAKAMDRLRASRIGGNLHAQEIGGTLDADQVGGNALLKGVAGALMLDWVAGNLVVKNLTAGAKVGRIGGNLMLKGDLGSGCTYHFKVDGNAMLRFSEEASAHLTLRANGKLLSSVVLADEEREGVTLTGILGDGGSEVVVEALGNIMLGAGQPAIGTELSEEISRQVEESLHAIDLEAIGRQVGEEMEAALSRLQVKLEGMDWDRTGLQAQRAVERAMERMRRDTDRVVEKAARHQARLEHRAEKKAHQVERRHQRAVLHQQRQGATVDRPDWPADEAAAALEPEPDLDAERLSILRMVEKGQITPKEAEMLLDALQ